MSDSTMADWLVLHGLTPESCLHLLGPEASEQVSAEHRPPEVTVPSGSDLWTLSSEILQVQAPALAAQIARTTEQTLTQFAPDTERFPRAFTLHDIGNGRPYVSCPCKGTAGDVIRVAHEFGHALQLMSGPPLPPVLREICAFASEALVVRGLRDRNPKLAEVASAVLVANTRHDLGRLHQDLRARLSQPDCPYDYDWNYPLSRCLTVRLMQMPDETLLTKLFCEGLSTVELTESLPAQV